MKTDNNTSGFKTAFKYLTMGLALGAVRGTHARPLVDKDSYYSDGYPMRREFVPDGKKIHGIDFPKHTPRKLHPDTPAYHMLPSELAMHDTNRFPAFYNDQDACGMPLHEMTPKKEEILAMIDEVAGLPAAASASQEPYQVSHFKTRIEQLYMALRISIQEKCTLNSFKLYALRELQMARAGKATDHLKKTEL